ncbi:hypothetical protein QM012_005136 [Aureobasidium pullulans]|uniref:F-box domain-containing protein n=1 Tax=Aureobasidium pullulans TaxID=5580 RepID=A0ABR0T5N2_AURPU
MPGLLQLPPELLARIVEFVAIGKPAQDDSCDFGNKNKYQASKDPAFSSWNRPYNKFGLTPRPDVASLQNLRLASRHFSHACEVQLYCCVRLLPDEASASWYNEILSTPRLAGSVQKVIFQTREVPVGKDSSWACQFPGPDDDCVEPHPFFLDALDQVGQFPNLEHVKMVFSIKCVGPRGFDDGNYQECEGFREEILSAFYAGLNHREHPATKVYDLSIKDLQDITPQVFIDGTDEDENGFVENYKQVMSKITDLSLQLATEENEYTPENTLHIPESHDFFGHELKTYWLGPIAENLVYLKLYTSEMYFGMYPKCNLRTFPRLRKLLVGNLSVVNDDPIDWILCHAATLEQLTLDCAMIAVGAKFNQRTVDVANRRVIYLPLTVEEGRPCYRPQPRPKSTQQRWLWSTRWHHIFKRFQHNLPHLKYFVFGEGNRGQNACFDEAEILSCKLTDEVSVL